MKNKYKFLTKLLITASLFSTSLSFNSMGAVTNTVPLQNVTLSTGSGLVGGVFNNGDTIKVAGIGLLNLDCLVNADKANAQIGAIDGLLNGIIPLFSFGGVNATKSFSIGPINNVVNAGPLTFSSDGITATLTGIGAKSFSTIDFVNHASTLATNGTFTVSSPLVNATNASLNIQTGITTITDASIANIKNLIINSTLALPIDAINLINPINFASVGAQLIVGGGTANSFTISAPILNGGNGKLEVKVALLAKDSSIGTLNNISIADNTAFTIDAALGNVDLLNNGATITFEGSNSRLNLINSSILNDRVFTLYNNLIPSSTVDLYGILELNSVNINHLLTLASGNGLKNIGQDNTHRLKQLLLDGFGKIIVNNQIFAQNIIINNTNEVTLADMVDTGSGGLIKFNAGAILNANDSIHSGIDFNGQTAILNIESGRTITGNIDNTGTNQKGSVVFLGSGNVMGNIGQTNAVAEVDFNGLGTVTLVGSSNSKIFNINNAAANITATLLMTGNIIYSADGKLSVGNGINGLVTTTSPNTGTLIVNAGNLTSKIGAAANSLKQVIFNGVTNLADTVNAQAITIGNAITNVTANALLTGNINFTDSGTLNLAAGASGGVDFQNHNGIVNLANTQTITGNITSTGGIKGILNFLGNGTVGGSIGTDNTNNLAAVNISGAAGTTVNLNNVIATILKFNNPLAIAGTAVINGNLMANVDFGTNGGTLQFAGLSPITFAGTISNGANGLLQVNTNLTCTNSSGSDVNQVHIKDNTTYTLDSINNNIDLLKNGAQIIFDGPNSRLQLANSSTVNDRIFTLYNNLLPSTTVDLYGILGINSTVKSLTLSSNDNTKTIGQDVTHRLRSLILEGAGPIILNVPVFAQTVNLNNTNIMTMNSVISTGNAGVVKFNANGMLNLNNNLNSNIDFNGNAGVINLADNQNITGTIDNTGAAGKGTLNILGKATITGAIGATNNLASVNFNGITTLNSTANAVNFTVNNGADVTSSGLMTGNVNFTAASKLVANGGVAGNVTVNNGTFNGNVTGNVSVGAGSFTGDITQNLSFTGGGATVTTTNLVSPVDFMNNPVTLNIKDAGHLVAVTSTGGVNGILNFVGNATVTSAINNINTINVQGASGKTVQFQGNVSTGSFNFSDGGLAHLTGSLSTTGNIDFGANGGVLEFAGNNPAGYILASPIVNGANGTLNIFANLTATDATVQAIKTINIGQATIPTIFTVDVTNGTGSGFFQTPNSSIIFGDAASVFKISTNATQTVTFKDNLPGITGNGGIVSLNANNGATLTLASSGGIKSIGVGPNNKIAQLNIKGNTAISPGASQVNLANILSLNIANGSIFTDASLSSSGIGAINIGDVQGAATYALDGVNAPGNAFNLATGNIKFNNANSILKLQTTALSPTISTITLIGDLVPTNANEGILELNAQNAGATLAIAGAGNLGTLGAKLKQLTFSGNGAITVTPTINTNSILLNIGAITLGNVNANVNFGTTTNFTVNNINGNVDFAGNAGTLNLTDGSKITGTIDSTMASAGILSLGAGTEVTGIIGGTNPLTQVNAIKGGNVTLDAAAKAALFTVGGGTNITANGLITGNVNYDVGAGTLVLNNGIAGTVNAATLGQGILTINRGPVTGVIGRTGALAQINIGANPITFTQNVSSNIVALTAAASDLTLTGMTLNGAVTVANAGDGTLTLNPGSSVNGTIGVNGTSIGSVNIGAGVASFGNNVYANNVVLTNNLSVLSINNATVNGNVTTTNPGNGVLNLNAGNVNGVIGRVGALLAQVNIGAGITTFLGDVYSNIVSLTTATSSLILNNGITVNSSVTTALPNEGVVTLNGNSQVTGAFGQNNANLAQVIFNGVTTINQSSFASNFILNNGSNVTAAANAMINGAVTLSGNAILDATAVGSGVTGNVSAATGIFSGSVTGSGSVTSGAFNGSVTTTASIGTGIFTGNVGGAASFTGNGTLVTTDVGGTIDFAGNAGTVNVADGGNLQGITSSVANIGGAVNFAGAANVAGSVNNIGAVTLNGVAGKIVTFANNLSAASLNFTNGGTARLQGSLAGAIDFGAVNGGILEFAGANLPVYTLDSVINNGAKGVLNVYTTLTATDPSIGSVQQINIGRAAVPQIFTINTNTGPLNLLQAAGSTVTFGDPGSIFGLTSSTGQVVTFHNSFGGTAGNGGIVELGGTSLVIQSSDGTKTLGTGADKLAAININGNVAINGAPTNKLDISNALTLNISNGSTFVDQSITSATIPLINIGDNTGPGSYGLDALNGDFNLNSANIAFVNNDSILKLQTTALAGTSTITLMGNLNSGAVNRGIVELDSANNGVTLKIAGPGLALGDTINKLKQLTFSGNGNFDIEPIINTETIALNVGNIALGDINSNVVFVRDTVYAANGNINGNVDFQGNQGIINIAGSKEITGSVTSTGTQSGIVNFLGSGQVNDLITNLAMLKVGAGNVSLVASGAYSITEIQGIGVNNLTLPNNFNLTGGVNLSAGQALNLLFTNGGSISGPIGSGSAVGDIAIQNGTVNFGSTVTGNNITVSNGATAQFNDNITANLNGGGAVKLSNPTPINISGTIDGNIIEVANNNVTITNAVTTPNIIFSNSITPTSITLNGSSTVTGATASGNNMNTILVGGDLITGTGSFGSPTNMLASVELTGTGTVTVNSNNFYSGVSSSNNNQGNVVLNSSGASVYDLGNTNNNLNNVQVSQNGTIKGNVNSSSVNIDSGVTVSFDQSGNNNAALKSLAVPNAVVDGVSLPRSITNFQYLTEINSNNFNLADATSSSDFKDPVLIQAPIDKGNLKFEDNVWFKQVITNASTLTFAPNKYSLLEKNIESANMIANNANLVVLDNIELKGDFAAKNAVLDLANKELKHSGNVTHTGALTIITYFDTALKKGGHILVGNGGNLDISALDNLIIKVKARSNINLITPGTKHQVVTSEAGGTITPVPATKITIDGSGEENRFVSWKSDPTGVTIFPVDNSGIVLPGDTDNGIGSGIGHQITPAPSGTDAANLRNDLGLMTSNQAKEALERLAERGYTIETGETPSFANDLAIEDVLTDISVEIDNIAAENIDGRIEGLRNDTTARRRLATSPASGDDDNGLSSGIWGVPFYSKAIQKNRTGMNGYKSQMSGATVGLDYLVNNNFIAGLAYTNFGSKLRHQAIRIGDITKIKGQLYSVYGLYNWPNNNWFIEGIGSYGTNTIKNNELRITSSGNETAASKFKSKSYSGEIIGGYNYMLPKNCTLTPMAGIRYAKFKNSSYKETGTTSQNLWVKKNSYNKVDGILGLRATKNFYLKDLILKPEIHGFINYGLKNKLPTIQAMMNGVEDPLITTQPKAARVSYNLGTGITVKHNMLEVGIKYNLRLAKKYVANQGSLKLKFNF